MKISNLRIVFLDADGTLWYPRETQRTIKPHWVYKDPKTKDTYLEHLTLTPGIKKLLENLYQKEIFIVIVSAHPGPYELAMEEMHRKLSYFELLDYIHSYHITPGNDPNGKTSVIRQCLNELNTKPSQGLMIGDSYYYDYIGGKNAGVNSYWIENTSCKQPETLPQDLTSIQEITDLLDDFSD